MERTAEQAMKYANSKRASAEAALVHSEFQIRAERELKAAEARIAAQIALQTNETGKAMFPNAESRAAELLILCANDPQIAKLRDEVDSHKHDAQAARIEADYANDLLQIALAFPER